MLGGAREKQSGIEQDLMGGTKSSDCTAAGVGLWPQRLVYPGQTESLNMAAAASM